VQKMPQLTVNLDVDKIRELVFQLPPKDFIQLAREIEERLETFEMMQLAESGFEEWDATQELMRDPAMREDVEEGRAQAARGEGRSWREVQRSVRD